MHLFAPSSGPNDKLGLSDLLIYHNGLTVNLTFSNENVFPCVRKRVHFLTGRGLYLDVVIDIEYPFLDKNKNSFGQLNFT